MIQTMALKSKYGFLADLDEKMKIVALSNKNSTEEEEEEEEENKIRDDSFAQRAEAYYRTRPQLLSLLNDLYNGYLSLADRYCRTLDKTDRCHGYPSPISAVRFSHRFDFNVHDQAEGAAFDGDEHVVESEAGSCVSYSAPTVFNAFISVDLVVAELLMKMVDFNIIVDELGAVERRLAESSRKIELQRSLLEVLESERVILLNENSRLGYAAAVLGEENKGLAAENMFMKRKAGELSRCVLKMREDHRVCMLIRKIEDLQMQIYDLERQNKDYCQQIAKRDGLLIQLQHQAKKNSKTGYGDATLGKCFQIDEEANVVAKHIYMGSSRGSASGSDSGGSNSSRGGRISKWWGRVKNLDLLQCGPHFKL